MSMAVAAVTMAVKMMQRAAEPAIDRTAIRPPIDAGYGLETRAAHRLAAHESE